MDFDAWMNETHRGKKKKVTSTNLHNRGFGILDWNLEKDFRHSCVEFISILSNSKHWSSFINSVHKQVSVLRV